MKRDYSDIDPKIQPLVDALNGIVGVHCRRAYQGRFNSSISPFVEFDAPVAMAALLALRLRSLWEEKKLNYWWEIIGRFDAAGRFEFTLQSPRLDQRRGAFSRFNIFVLKRELIDSDLKALTEKLLGPGNSPQHLGEIWNRQKQRDSEVEAPAVLKLARAFIAVVFLTTTLTACGSSREIQKDGSGTDEMLKSPCVCVPVPYDAPGYEWVS